MPKAQPQTPLIRQSPLSGQWYCLTKYKQKDNLITVTAEHGRHDVTEQIRQIIIMETEMIVNQRDALLAACKEALPIIGAHYDWEQSQRELLAGFRKSEPVKRPIEITLKDTIAMMERDLT